MISLKGLEARVKAKTAKQKEKAEKELKLLKRDIAIASASPEGLNMMKWIFDLSGYDKTLVVGNPQTLDLHTVGTVYNEARRGLWLQIRKMLPRRTLKKIEFDKLNLDVEEL